MSIAGGAELSTTGIYLCARVHAQAKWFGRMGEGENSVGSGDAEIGVVGDEQIAVKVEIIGERCEMCGGTDVDAGFAHAADHGFEASFAGGQEGFEAASDAAG